MPVIKKKYLILILIIVSVIVYSNTLKHDFVWDDVDIARENPDIRSFGNIPKLLLSPYGHPSQFSKNILFYRPAVMISYVADYSIWGVNGGGFHFTNVLLHSLTTVAIFILLLKICGSLELSFISSLIFSAHPIHTQSVAWISGRTDILCTLFYILSIYFFLDSGKRKGWKYGLILSLSFICFFISLLSKEMAITLPLLLIIIDALYRKDGFADFLKKHFLKYTAFIPLVALYLFLRFEAMGGNLIQSSKDSLADRIFPMFRTVSDYLTLLLFPFNLNTLYPPEKAPIHAVTILSFLLYFLLIMLLWFLVMKRNRKHFLFASLWFIATLLPVSNIVPFSPTLKTEYFLYLPSVGFALLAGILITDVAERFKNGSGKRAQIIFVSLIVLITLFFSSLSFTRNRIWKDELTLFSNQVDRNPGFARARFNLGLAYKENGNTGKALEEFKNAISIDPKMNYAYVNIGNIFFDKNDINNAYSYYLKALELNPFDGYLRNNLGVVYAIKGNSDKALKEFEESIKYNPEYISPYINIGNLYAITGDFEKSLFYLNKAVEMDKSNTNKAFIVRASVFLKKGQLKEAEDDLDYASDRFSNKQSFLIQLADTLNDAGKLSDSLRVFRKAQKFNKSDKLLNNKIRSLEKLLK